MQRCSTTEDPGGGGFGTVPEHKMYSSTPSDQMSTADVILADGGAPPPLGGGVYLPPRWCGEQGWPPPPARPRRPAPRLLGCPSGILRYAEVRYLQLHIEGRQRLRLVLVVVRS